MFSPNRVDSKISFQRRTENEEEDSDLQASHGRERVDDVDSTADGDLSSEDSGIQTQLASIATVLKDVVRELNKLKQDRQTSSTAICMNTNNNKDKSTGASAVESGSATYTRNGVAGPLQGREYRDGSRQVYENITSHGRYSVPRYQDGTGAEERGAYVHRYDSERRDLDEVILNYDRRQADQTRDSSRYGPEVRYANDMEPHGVRFATPLVAKPLPVKLPAYSGKEEWATWIAQFEIIASRYHWSEDERLNQLLPRLEGAVAQFVLTQLSPHIINHYHELIAEINSRFRVIETPGAFAAKFSRRSQRHGESLEEYAAELKRLYDKAHSYRDRRTRDEDLVRRFLDGLSDEELKFEIEFNKDPRNIDEALYYAVNYIQIRKSGRGERRDKHNARRVTPSYSGERDFRSYRDAGEKGAVAKKPNAKWTPKGSSEGVRKQMEAETDKTNNNHIKELLSRIEKLERQDGPSRWSGTERRNVECFRCHKQGITQGNVQVHQTTAQKTALS